jgi:hypothetical protein
MPGGMGGGGGAHVPSSVHVPGSVGGGAGGAHVPSSVHVPGSVGGGAGGAHIPSSVHVPGSANSVHTPSSVNSVHTPGAVQHPQHVPAAQAHATPSQSHIQQAGLKKPVVNTEDHGGGPHPSAVHGAGGAHQETGHVATGVSHPATTHGMVAHKAGTDTVMRGAHGRLVLASAGGGAMAHAPRPYIHSDLHAHTPRKPDEVSHDRDFVHAHEHDFHTSRVRDFTPREMAAWRHGLWRDEWHYGRRGWWYEDDGVWYPYDDPEYPYPLEVAPLVVYDTTVVADGDEVPPEEPVPVPDAAPAPGAPVAGVTVNGTVVATIAPLPAPPPGWYRCGEPAGYYPSVGACSGPWILEPDASPGGPPPGSP